MSAALHTPAQIKRLVEIGMGKLTSGCEFGAKNAAIGSLSLRRINVSMLEAFEANDLIEWRPVEWSKVSRVAVLTDAGRAAIAAATGSASHG
jgi:DNA-binding MarR family transcriptional regulator